MPGCPLPSWHLGTRWLVFRGFQPAPQAHFCWATFKPLSPVALPAVVVTKVQDLALGLKKTDTTGPGPLIQPVQNSLQSLPTLQQINTPAQHCVICKLSEGALDSLLQIIDKEIKQDCPKYWALGNTTDIMLFIEYKAENVLKERMFPSIWCLLTLWGSQSKANVIFSQEITSIFCCYGNLCGGLVFVCLFWKCQWNQCEKTNTFIWKKEALWNIFYQNQMILNNNKCHCSRGNEEAIKWN